jgi:GNAT superfamily N-acetyltransferase
VRFVKKDDVALLVEMFNRLSPESQRLRFHLYTARLLPERLWQEATDLCNVDPRCNVALVATVIEGDGKEHAVGVARFVRASAADEEAEIAVVIRDDFQRRGLGKHLLLTLADQARAVGLLYFTAWVMTENVRLMKLIKNMELKNVKSETRHGQKKIRVPL